ncbi:hypothetical protein FOCC_FOCC002250 [Frankliniella occidentalis]|nr:hypothetical protein FOCC_FOCC002250 [Frankliniella occidentalis]
MSSGYQIADPAALMSQMEALVRHPEECQNGGRFTYLDETHCGLGANKTHDHNNEMHNDALAYGTMAIGSGYANMQELFGILDMPFPGKTKFRRHMVQAGQTIKKYREEILTRNGQEEYRRAKEKGQIVKDEHGNDTDICWTTVIGDAGWGKRAYGGKNMTSPAAAALLIAKLTMLPVFIDKRGSECTTCDTAFKKNVEPPIHDCAKNWDGSATAMESDMIVAGFNESIARHKLQYRYYIGDGDSSTYPQIRAQCAYGHLVVKLHCANHVTVRLSDHLHNLVKNTLYPVGARNALKAVVSDQLARPQTRIDRLVKGVRTAIRTCEEQQLGVAALQEALRNAPFHAFGRHDGCGDWCRRRDAETPERDEVDTARQGGLFQAIQADVDSLIRKSDTLVRNQTTNAAENFMSLLAKANGGKRVPHWKGPGWAYRADMAVINHSEGSGYHAAPLKKHTGKERTPKRTRALCNSRQEASARRREGRLAKRAAGEPVAKRRRTGAGPDMHYGPQAELSAEEKRKLQLEQKEQERERQEQRLKDNPDIPEADLQVAKCAVLKHLELQVSTEDKRKHLQSLTGQHKSSEYRQVRGYALLPSSMFGRVMSRMDSTPCDALVRELVYPTSGMGRLSEAMQYGIDHEETAVRKFVLEHKVSEPPVECGLYIDPKWPFLATTPDRLLGTEGLIEVKCIFPGTLARRKVDNFRAAASLKGKEKGNLGLCLELVDGQLRLKRSHAYYYQIQGQLAITGRQYCMLVVFTDSALIDNWKGARVVDLFVEKIARDVELWDDKMVPKLTTFYFDCMLVEICLRRKNRGLPCRDPDWKTKPGTRGKGKKRKAKDQGGGQQQ